MIFNSR